MPVRKVLLVDDSLVARLMASHIVSTAHPDWPIVEATDGEAALERARQDPPDYVLLDVNMPGIDGLTAARRLKEICPQAAICLITANIQDHIRDQARALGIGFLDKPVREDMLLAFLDGGAP